MKKKLFFILTSAIVLLSPKSIFSQAVANLNSADSFVLFTANGNFTATPSNFPIIVGNVGNEGGTYSAFPPGFLAGAAHAGDAVATQAGIDILAAYNDLAGRTCGSNHGLAFGGGESLSPGVHCADPGAASLSGNLTLDGGGNSQAVFIIKINGAFSSVSGAQVILTNGTAPCNVFWQINGTVDLDNTTFKGTAIANGAVNLTSLTTINGRVLTTAGNFTFGPISGNLCDLSLLPLQLLNFEVAKTTGNVVEISWITAAEVNVLKYEVEASINGGPFMKIGTLAPKGNGTPARYNLQDLQANKTGVRLYRLKMIDRDGSVNYSAIRSLKFSEMKFGLVNIFPNPAGNTINISVNTEAREKIILTITNLQGQEVLQKTLVANKGINNFAEDVRHLAQATYIATIKNIKTGKESHQNFQKL
jgi:hypothetical protein